MQAEGRARQSTGPHGSLVRVGERLQESLQGAARRTTDIREDICVELMQIVTSNTNV